MSLEIDYATVTAILLPDGGHDVASGTFDTDSYEFVEAVPGESIPKLIVGGGTVQGVPATGFTFRETNGKEIVGPLTSILALRR